MIVALAALPMPAFADEVATGRELVETYCSDCHATGPEGDSPVPPAPPFRKLSERYDVELLDEALVEGLVTGHEMPEFEFDPDQARAIIEYLSTLQAEAVEQP